MASRKKAPARKRPAASKKRAAVRYILIVGGVELGRHGSLAGAEKDARDRNVTPGRGEIQPDRGAGAIRRNSGPGGAWV